MDRLSSTDLATNNILPYIAIEKPWTMTKGHCHCGQTEWDVDLVDANTVLCHCDACKMLSGGGFTLNQILPKKNFKLTKGNLSTYSYKGDSGKSVDCYYCPNCTSHAYHHQEVMGDDIVVRTIFLEGGKDMKPAAEVYGKARLGWVPEVATTFETMPPS
ncbi:MAG: hypothetical protein M1837_004688 [Sclerophora amabilis]|nr:MAG: hypothetical protein M1837_004688 [Sclerophora amabilis]